MEQERHSGCFLRNDNMFKLIHVSLHDQESKGSLDMVVEVITALLQQMYVSKLL